MFSITASQASSERCFSVGTNICTPKRSNLKPAKIEELVTIKINKGPVQAYNDLYKVPKLVKPKDAVIEYDMNPFVEELRLGDEDPAADDERIFAQLSDDELEDMFINV